jgi:short-subunit dehydrogenase/uncharacterized OB-fold protein
MTREKSNPLKRTRAMILPPGARSTAAHHLTAAAAKGAFALPCCTACGRFCWPMPEACPACLAPMTLASAPRGGRVMSATTAEVPAHPYFRDRAPWRVGLVAMDCGPQALVHLHPAAIPGTTVDLTLMLDRSGQAVLHAGPKGGDMASDPQWQEMVADPRDRRILITDARHFAALALAQALSRAGAASIHLGLPDPWKPFAARAAFEEVPGVQLVPLDVTSDRSVADLAAGLAGRIEILVNSADLVRPGGLLGATAAGDARAMGDTLAQGLLRLARGFAPAMAMRGADGTKGAVAWVNIGSVFGLVPSPGWAGYAAAHAAALALSTALRAELATGGIRLMTVLTGPTEDLGFQREGLPRVTARALAEAVLAGLMRGLEEVVVGDVARDLVARLADNPKGLERSFWMTGGRG